MGHGIAEILPMPSVERGMGMERKSIAGAQRKKEKWAYREKRIVVPKGRHVFGH